MWSWTSLRILELGEDYGSSRKISKSDNNKKKAVPQKHDL